MAQSQVWLVTGASRGLGVQIAKAALAAGHTVIACHRSKGKLGSTLEEIEALGGTWVELDVAANDVEARVASVIEKHGKIDVVVNNAGYGLLGSIEDTTPEMVESIFKTNVFGPLRIIQAALPSMRARKAGTIVNIGSSNGIKPVPGLGIYATTKFAVEGLTEALQAELASFNIRTILVEPGLINTEMTSTSGSGVSVPITEAYEGSIVHQVAQVIASDQRAHLAADPAKVAQRIVEAVDGTGLFASKNVALRLPLGADCGADVEGRAAYWGELAKDTKEVWASI